MTVQLQITRPGGPDVLELMQLPSASLFSDSVRIQVKAAGVNFADIMMRMGLYPEAPKPPFTPGYEIAGEVIEVGSQVQNFKVGDRVVGGTRFGGYTSEIVLPEFQIRKIPGHLTYEEAAGILVNFITAWVALQEMGRIRRGDRVLIPSAAGGVGIAAVQIASLAGAQVVGLVSSRTKAHLVHALGAAEVYTYDEWENLKEEYGYQLILNAAGGASIKQQFKRLAPAGRLIAYGASTLVGGEKRSYNKILSLLWNTAFFTPYQLMDQNKGIFGLNLLRLFEPAGSEGLIQMLQSFDQVLEHFEKRNFRVIIGKTFPLEQGGEAHNWLQNRANTGKVVLIPDK